MMTNKILLGPVIALIVGSQLASGCKRRQDSSLKTQSGNSERAPVASSTRDAVRLSQSLVGILVRSNQNEVPVDFAGWERLVRTLGTPMTAVIPFTSAPNPSTLELPRLLLTAVPGESRRTARMTVANSGLFLAFNYDATETPPLIEFISWNRQANKFDFGLIRSGVGLPTIEFVPTENCVSCHRARGPIFPNESWSSTATNPAVFRAMIDTMLEGASEPWRTELKAASQAVKTVARDLAARREQRTLPDAEGVPDRITDIYATESFRAIPAIADLRFRGATLFQGFVNNSESINLFDNNAVRAEYPALYLHQYIEQLPTPEAKVKMVSGLIKYFLASALGYPQLTERLRVRAADLISRSPLTCHTRGLFRTPTLRDFNPSLNLEVPAEETLRNFLDSANDFTQDAIVDAIKAYNVDRRRGRGQNPPEFRPTNDSAFLHSTVQFIPANLTSGRELPTIASALLLADVDLSAFKDQLDSAIAAVRARMNIASSAMLYEYLRSLALFYDPAASESDLAPPSQTQDLMALANRRFATPGAMASPPMVALLARGLFPPREELLAALTEGLNQFFSAEFNVPFTFPPSSYRLAAVPVLDQREDLDVNPLSCGQTVQTVRVCAGCHHPGEGGFNPQFDMSERSEWTPARVAAYKTRVVNALTSNTMPPQGSRQANFLDQRPAANGENPVSQAEQETRRLTLIRMIESL